MRKCSLVLAILGSVTWAPECTGQETGSTLALDRLQGRPGLAHAAENVGADRPPAQFLSARTEIVAGASDSIPIKPEPAFNSPLLAAAGLGLLGWGSGVLAGHAIQGDCESDFCELEGVIYGGAAGGGLGLAIGAHLGNRHRGSFLVDLLTSAAVWGIGFSAMRGFAAAGDGAGVYATAIALPPVQLLTTVFVERAVGRSRAAKAEKQ